jgi:hypothetical protein
MRKRIIGSMETLRIAVKSPDRKEWLRAAWPVLALGVAAMLEQSTRGPSVASLVLQLVF